MQMASPQRTTSRSRLNLKNCKHTITVRVEKGMKKWGISLLGEMPHFIILVILFAANPLNSWIPRQISLQIQVLRARVGFKDQFQIFDNIQIV